jgi:hypothetical protein
MIDNTEEEQDLDIWDMVGEHQDAPDMNSDQSSILHLALTIPPYQHLSHPLNPLAQCPLL